MTFDRVMLFLTQAWGTTSQLGVEGYAAAPALMIGLAAMALVPALALGGVVVGFIARRRAQQAAAAVTATGPTAIIDDLATSCAWITIEGETPPRRVMAREMLSIGRQDDNVVQLEDAGVHRHHALVHRAPDTRVFIRDLSGRGGNGVKVNGERVWSRALKNGDRIEIGAKVLTFEAPNA